MSDDFILFLLIELFLGKLNVCIITHILLFCLNYYCVVVCCNIITIVNIDFILFILLPSYSYITSLRVLSSYNSNNNLIIINQYLIPTYPQLR